LKVPDDDIDFLAYTSAPVNAPESFVRFQDRVEQAGFSVVNLVGLFSYCGIDLRDDLQRLADPQRETVRLKLQRADAPIGLQIGLSARTRRIAALTDSPMAGLLLATAGQMRDDGGGNVLATPSGAIAPNELSALQHELNAIGASDFLEIIEVDPGVLFPMGRQQERNPPSEVRRRIVGFD
jgi:hypothetical protein